MASKKVINYQWRLFLPSAITLWVVMIAMAWWQLYRVGEIKREMVFDQLAFIGDRVVDFYNNGDPEGAANFMKFSTIFYDEKPEYDMISVQVRKSNSDEVVNMGHFIPFNEPLGKNDSPTGVLKISQKAHESKAIDADKYLYYVTYTARGSEVIVMLPYTKAVANVLSGKTSRFWLFFMSIAIFVTIFVYITSAYFGRNVRILRDFARNAAKNSQLIDPESVDFPHDELGDISRQIVTIFNQRIAEMERREKDHSVALHAIEEKDRIKRELTGNINHEIKTPVGVIQGYIDTILSNPDMDAATKQRFLEKTQQSVHRLSALISDISAITRLDSGDKLVNLSEVNFHDLVYTFENYLQEANILKGKLEFSYYVPLNCMVQANDALLTSVLLNLTKNAVAYSGGTMCRLELVDVDEDFYYFSFYDDGVGVSPENLPHMFERFFRVNAGRSRETGGTGLGLSIAQVSIRSFGGEIDVMNRYPSGLQFNFSLKKYKISLPDDDYSQPHRR